MHKSLALTHSLLCSKTTEIELYIQVNCNSYNTIAHIYHVSIIINTSMECTCT